MLPLEFLVPGFSTSSNGVLFLEFRFHCTILASQKIAIAEKSLRFQIAKYYIAGFAAEIAGKSPENRRRNRRKIASDFLGRGIEIAAFPRFQIAAFSGR